MLPHANVHLQWIPNILPQQPEDFLFFQFFVEKIQVLPCGTELIEDRQMLVFPVSRYDLDNEYTLEERIAFMICHFFYPSWLTMQINEAIREFVLFHSERWHDPYLKIDIYMYKEAEVREDDVEVSFLDYDEELEWEDMEEDMEGHDEEGVELQQALADLMEGGFGGGGGFGGVPASQSAIETLQTLKYEGVQGEVKDKGCSICFDDFVVGMEVKSMPCSHIFHGDCISRWLENSHICPLCRFEMPTGEGEDDDDM